MDICVQIDASVPSGFYCEKGKKRCYRLNKDSAYKSPYCELFYPFLAVDSEGKILKCEKCLLAEREARTRL